jgi:hypothetical protein
MNPRDAQGSFIALIWTLIAKVKEVTGSVCIHPRPGVVADLVLLPVVTRSVQRRQAEEANLSHRAYRFSSVDNAVRHYGRRGPSTISLRVSDTSAPV